MWWSLVQRGPGELRAHVNDDQQLSKYYWTHEGEQILWTGDFNMHIGLKHVAHCQQGKLKSDPQPFFQSSVLKRNDKLTMGLKLAKTSWSRICFLKKFSTGEGDISDVCNHHYQDMSIMLYEICWHKIKRPQFRRRRHMIILHTVGKWGWAEFQESMLTESLVTHLRGVVFWERSSIVVVKHSVHKLEQLFLVQVFNGCFVVVCFGRLKQYIIISTGFLKFLFMNLKTNGLIFSF